MRGLGAFLLLLILTQVDYGKSYTLGVYVLLDRSLEGMFNEFDRGLYFSAYFNAVNLVFSKMRSPPVNFRVVGIEDTADAARLRRAYNGRGNDQNIPGLWPMKIALREGFPEDGPTTRNLTTYFSSVGAPYNRSHIIVFFARWGIWSNQVEHDKGNKGRRPPLYVNRYPERESICKRNSIVMVKDTGAFSNITSTARKIARLLGTNYDYHTKEGCLYSSGMLMGSTKTRENPLMSNCTQQEIKASLDNHFKQDCLLRQFHGEGLTYTNQLPAEVMSRNQLCAQLAPGKDNIAECTEDKWSLSGYPYPKMCEVRCCYGTVDGGRNFRRIPYGLFMHPAIYGHPCNDGRVRNGVCAGDVCVNRPS